MRRVMCVWCPLWPIQRLRSAGMKDLAPLVIFAEGRRGLQVNLCSPEAADWGIRAGMPLGEAQSLLPVSTSKPPRTTRRNGAQRGIPPALPVLKRADPAADRSRLQELALHCQIYSPLVGLEEAPSPESLWLDISGSEVLFGGEQGLAEKLQDDLAQQGIQARVAVADSWGAAWGVSHYGEADISLVPSGQQTNWLSSLPIAALRISPSIKQSLQSLDVTTIGQLLRIPRASLPSRFGKELVRRIDHALGLAPELLQAERLAEPVFEEWLFEEPVSDRQTLDHVCEVLLERLLTRLLASRAGLREFACHWLGTLTEPTLLRLLRPTTEKRHLTELLRLQNERRVFMSGVHGVRMEVVEVGLPPLRQATLFGDDAGDEHPQALAELVDRLSMRLGRQAVLRPRLIPDPQPEFAFESVPWLDTPASVEKETVGVASHLRCRPLRLFRSPQPLVVQQFSSEGVPTRVQRSTVILVSGPERIEVGWWRGLDVKRDYYRLSLANGAILWAFVDRDTGAWFLHGLFV
jgi:protein ImuB